MDGNGRMSRLLTLLLLYKNGYIVGKYISIEKLVENSKESYYASLMKSSVNWHENKNDYSFFGIKIRGSISPFDISSLYDVHNNSIASGVSKAETGLNLIFILVSF